MGALIIGVGGSGKVSGGAGGDNWYGIEWDTLVSNPECTRIGKPELHVSLPLQSKMRRCLLADDGTVNAYLDPYDSTKLENGEDADLSGASGQVMVELPDVYVKFETEGTKQRCKMSESPLPGYKKWGKDYISAYEAALQRSTLKLSSVANEETDYRGGNNTAGWDGTYRSLLGMPVTNLTMDNMRKYAHNRGAGWQMQTYHVYKKLVWLYFVEYANFNSQAEFNAELTSEGYRQGGLGDGVTVLADAKWNSFNSYYPFVKCGYTNGLGNTTGVVEFTMPEEYNSGEKPVMMVPSYRGVENPYGHTYPWTDGILVDIQSESAGGRSLMYKCSDPDKYASTLNDGYELFGNAPRATAYIKILTFGEDGDIMPLVPGASSTTFFCDNFYTTVPSSGTSLRGVRFGGCSVTGAGAGFVYSDTNNTPSTAAARLGSRLCFEPANR